MVKYKITEDKHGYHWDTGAFGIFMGIVKGEENFKNLVILSRYTKYVKFRISDFWYHNIERTQELVDFLICNGLIEIDRNYSGEEELDSRIHKFYLQPSGTGMSQSSEKKKEKKLSRWVRFWCWFNDHRPYHEGQVRESPRNALEGFAAASFEDVTCDRCKRDIRYSNQWMCWKVKNDEQD